LDNIEFTNSNKNARLIFSKPKRFGGDINAMHISESNYLKNEWIFNATTQVQLINEMNRVPFWYSSTLFYKKEVYDLIKFNENYPNIEDIPFILKCLRSGIKLYYFPNYTVNYRFGHDGSVQHSQSNKRSYFELYRKEFFRHDIKNKGVLVAWDFLLTYFIKTKKNKSYKYLILFSPIFLFRKSKKVINK
jgi:hypothetical protein